MPSTEEAHRAIKVLLAKLLLWDAGMGELTHGEWSLINRLSDWYEDQKRIVERR